MPTAPEPPDPGSPAPGTVEERAAAVEEQAVWLEVNGRPAVTWMCTPEHLEELAIGWLHGEGYIRDLDDVRLRPCATDLGFWADIPPERLQAVEAERRRPVMASGCGAVATFLALPLQLDQTPPRGPPPSRGAMRALVTNDHDLSTMPHLESWLGLVEPVVVALRRNYAHLTGDKNQLLTATAEENVLFAIENLQAYPSVARKLADGELAVHGWCFKIATAETFAYDPASGPGWTWRQESQEHP